MHVNNNNNNNKTKIWIKEYVSYKIQK